MTTHDMPSNAEYLEQFAPIVEAWGAHGFMDDPRWGKSKNFGNDFVRAATAQMLENARNHFLPQSNVANPKRNAVTVSEAHKRNIEAALKIAERQAQESGPLPIAEASSPVDTTAMTNATNLPMVLGYIRKIMPRMDVLSFVSVQPMALPTGRVFFIDRIRHDNGTDRGSIEARAGWSFRSWDKSPGENTTVTKTTKFTLASEDVTAGNHKLLTEIGIEIEQDMRAYHGIDGAALIQDAAAEEMATELQEVILYEMWARAGAGTFQIGVKPSGFTVSEWDRRLLEVFQRANESIWTNQRVDARHLILGSDWSVDLSNVNNTFAPAPVADFAQGKANASDGVRQIGDYLTMKASLPFPTDYGLLLHRGASWIDASYFYLPYQLFQPYSIFRDPTTQTVKMSWLSRYATFMVGTYFRGDKRVALLRKNSALTGTSYPAFVESTGGNG